MNQYTSFKRIGKMETPSRILYRSFHNSEKKCQKVTECKQFELRSELQNMREQMNDLEEEVKELKMSLKKKQSEFKNNQNQVQRRAQTYSVMKKRSMKDKMEEIKQANANLRQIKIQIKKLTQKQNLLILTLCNQEQMIHFLEKKISRLEDQPYLYEKYTLRRPKFILQQI